MTEWAEETIQQLRALWAEGHSTLEIGRRLNISKNAVVGKAHRSNLPARPSPIAHRPDGAPRPAPAPKRLYGAAVVAIVGAAPVKIEEKPVRFLRKPTPCCWPFGEPGKPSFRFCDVPSVPGRPYCEEHMIKARRRNQDEREDAA